MNENLKVAWASILGIGTPAVNVNWFVSLEPFLKTVLFLGQIGVAIATIIYILAKIRKLRRK